MDVQTKDNPECVTEVSDSLDVSMKQGETLREWIERLGLPMVTTKEAALILGVSQYRVNQLMAEPCPKCGQRVYERSYGKVDITDYPGQGCERCHYTGYRLPSWRLGLGKKAPHMIARVDLEIPDIKNRQAGFPGKDTKR